MTFLPTDSLPAPRVPFDPSNPAASQPSESPPDKEPPFDPLTFLDLSDDEEPSPPRTVTSFSSLEPREITAELPPDKSALPHLFQHISEDGPSSLQRPPTPDRSLTQRDGELTSHQPQKEEQQADPDTAALFLSRQYQPPLPGITELFGPDPYHHPQNRPPLFPRRELYQEMEWFDPNAPNPPFNLGYTYQRELNQLPAHMTHQRMPLTIQHMYTSHGQAHYSQGYCWL